MISNLFSIKRAQRYLLWIRRNEFSKNSTITLFTLRHLPSKHDILTIVAPNYVRSEPMETRHPKNFRDTKFEEIKAFEYLLKAALKHD